MATAQYAFVAAMDIPAHLEADFNRVYDTQHVPEIVKVPGVKRCTRYRLVRARTEGIPRYLAIYEIDTPTLPDTAPWKAASDAGDWNAEIKPHTSNRRLATFEKISEKMKARTKSAYIYVAAMETAPSLEADFNRIYETQHVPEIIKVPGVNGCTRYRLVTARTEGTPRYMAIYEIVSPDLPDSPIWKSASDTGDWKPKIRPHTTNRRIATFEKIAEVKGKN